MTIPHRQSQETKDGLIRASNALFDPLKKKKPVFAETDWNTISVFD